LISLLRAGADSFYPDSDGCRSRPQQIRYNALIDTTRKFEALLQEKYDSNITIDEALISAFDSFLSDRSTSEGQRRIHRSAIVKLLNSLPRSYMRRRVLTLAQAKRANRFDSYTGATKDALEHFLRNGKKLRRGTTHQSPILSANPLSEVLRKQVVDSTLTFMSAIKASDLFSITEEDVEEYVAQHERNGSKSTAYKVLDYIRPLFSNLRCRGLLATDPLRLIPRQVSGIDLDYVDQESIDKLADLTTLDMDDFVDVRGRLLSFALDYAYALRNRESSLVRCCDFHGVELRLPREIQKVKRDTLPIYSYFPEVTDPLMKRYLELRALKSPETDILMISIDGNPLGADGCRRAVQEHCNRLGIKTHEGKPVNPHRLRHSFGTLNIDPLGICLKLEQIKEQLRHCSIQMTYDVYVTKNPMQKRTSYDKTMARINGNGSNRDQHSASPPTPRRTPNEMIGENDALRELLPLGLSYKSLRKYALEQGAGQQDGEGFQYSSAFISDLAVNYFTRREAMDVLNMASSTFFDWTKREAVEFILIGKVSLFRRDVIMAKRRAS